MPDLPQLLSLPPLSPCNPLLVGEEINSRLVCLHLQEFVFVGGECICFLVCLFSAVGGRISFFLRSFPHPGEVGRFPNPLSPRLLQHHFFSFLHDIHPPFPFALYTPLCISASFIYLYTPNSSFCYSCLPFQEVCK